MKNSIILVLGILMLCSEANAGRYWPPTLTTWSLSLNNGVAYISSPDFASHCSYSRGQINMDGTEFNKAQFSYAMAAKAKGKKMAYVVDDTQTACIVTGLKEVD
jgi:hypothetical protein